MTWGWNGHLYYNEQLEMVCWSNRNVYKETDGWLRRYNAKVIYGWVYVRAVSIYSRVKGK